jgi:hypothetical protein
MQYKGTTQAFEHCSIDARIGVLYVVYFAWYLPFALGSAPVAVQDTVETVPLWHHGATNRLKLADP